MKKIILGILIFAVLIFCLCFFLTGKTKAQGENYGDWEQTSSPEPTPGSEGMGSEDIYIPADNPEPGNPDTMTLEQNSALVGPISVSDDEGGGASGAGASGGTLEFAPGNESVRTPEGGFAYEMIDENGVKNLYTLENGQAYLYEGGTGGGAGQGNIPAAPQPVGVAPDGAFVYKDPQTGGLIFNDGAVVEDPTKVNFYNNGQGESMEIKTYDLIGKTEGGNYAYKDAQGNYYEMDMKKGMVPLEGSNKAINMISPGEQGAASQITKGSVATDSSTGKITTFTDDKASYRVDYNSAGQPYYTNSAGQQVLLGQSSGGFAYGVPAASMGAISGGAGSWLSNLLGLSGGIGYNKAMGGIYGGLGFGSTSGYGASSGGTMVGGGGGILSSLFGTSGTGTSTTGGFGYTPGQGWSGGAGFSSTSGSSYGAGGYGGGYASPMGYFGMGGGGWNPGNYLSTGLPAGSIYNIIQSVTLWILAIFGFICIIGFIISGIMYLTAAGDDEQQKKAKKALYYSITGVIVGLVGLVIIFAVNALLHGASYF